MNRAWAQESKPAPYRAQLMARAVENGVAIVAANAPANVKGQQRLARSEPDCGRRE